MKSRITSLRFYIGVLAANFILPNTASANSCPINADTKVVYFAGMDHEGTPSDTRGWMENFLDWAENRDASFKIQGLNSQDIRKNCQLSDHSNLKLYIQPGGNAYKQQLALGESGKQNIRKFITQAHGRYFGVCAGFYYASKRYFWNSNIHEWENLAGFIPFSFGPFTSLADFFSTEPKKVVPVIHKKDSSIFKMLYYGGPSIDPSTLAETDQVHFTFGDLAGDTPAIIEKGSLLLSSVHPEAILSDKVEQEKNYHFLLELLNNFMNKKKE